jgi:hypothetical protein
MARTVKQVAEALDRVQRRLPPTDGVKWFAWLYADVTRAIVRLFEQDELQSPDFMGDLVVRFGNTFLASVDHPSRAPRAWQPLFERRHDRAVAPLQFAMAGLNAHVGAELPVGLADAARRLDIDLSHAHAEHDDWTKVNATIAEVDPAFGELDDLAATWSVEAAREAAWAQGRVVWRLGDTAFLRDPYVGTLERSTRMVCRLLLVPRVV